MSRDLDIPQSKKIVELQEYTKEFNTYNSKFDFELDDFQKHALDIINNTEQHNILVTAHTGSGKSLIAEYIIEYNANRGYNTIYTSPIKSLSNQKFYDFKKKFTNISIGLITGDHKCNPNAQCIIVTTEILLNSIMFSNYKVDNLFDINLDNVKTIIFDEVHYINDIDRGNIWEQCIMKLSPSINQVLLSATINKPEIFASWIQSCNNLPTYLLKTCIRPIPLYFNIFFTIHSTMLDKLCDNKYIKGLNPKTSILLKNNMNLINNLLPIKSTIDNNLNLTSYNTLSTLNTELYKYKDRYITDYSILNNTINYLDINKMTPCLIFVMSRKKIYNYTINFNKILNTPREQIQVKNEFEKYLMKVNDTLYNSIPYVNEVKELAIKGCALHHSGLYPILKEIIELLYCKGLIKILFATETFSVGLNMPTKTVIFTSVNKYSNSGYRLLTSAEFIQMAGRAGRRGIDIEGYVIYLPQLEREFIKADILKQVFEDKLSNLESKYSITPSLLLNSLLLQNNLLEEVKKTMLYYSFLKIYDDPEKVINTSIESCSSFLKEFNFIQSDNTVTEFGISSHYLKGEANPLFLVILLNDSKILELDTTTLVIYLSIFCDKYDIEKNDELYEYINILNCNMITSLIDKELLVTSEWGISVSNIDAVKFWIENKNFYEIQQYYKENYNYHIYEGNFIRNMLRLLNIIKVTMLYFKAKGNIALYDELTKIETIINRDIVISESIYLNI